MRFARLPLENRPTPPAPRTDDRLAALAGLAVWALSLVVVLTQRESLVADDRGWWVWACVAGLVLGVVGLLHLQRREIAHRTAVRRARRGRAPETGGAATGTSLERTAPSSTTTTTTGTGTAADAPTPDGSAGDTRTVAP